MEETTMPKPGFFAKLKGMLRKICKKKWVKRLVILLLVLAAAGAAASVLFQKAGGESGESVRTGTVSRQTIQSALSSSGTLAALNTYNITSLVSGEVISADFEEGDQVEKGDVLFRVDTDSVDEKISSSQTKLERAQKSYQDALEDYSKAAKNYSSLNYTADLEGYLSALYVEAGDTIQAGAKIADLYNHTIMVLKAPFLASSIGQISVGDTAEITVSNTLDTLQGKVTAVSSMDQTLSGGRIVRMVSMEVENPGGLSEDYSATAVVNGIACSGDGSFTPILEKTITAEYGGEIDRLSVSEGDYVTAGTTLFTLTGDSAEEQLKSVKTALENAEQSLEDAETDLENQQDSLSDYEITAPISGQVIVKNVKAGDTLNSNSNNSSTLATIYDMSALTFEMSVDELDVLSVKAGQTVEVTADAIEGQTFTGKVTNVSLVSSYSNGVTQYPVTVQLDETGDLLPGMNVTAKIILEEAEDALAIPAQALMRGNTVYVQDNSVKESDGRVPAGFRSVEVETGLISEDYVEILSGLSEGDVVYIDPTSSTDSTAAFGMNGMGGMPGGGGMPSGGGMPGGGGGMPGGGF